QAQRVVRIALAQAIGDLEEALAVLGRFEDEGRGLKQRRLDRALRQGRIIAVAHHQGFGREGAVAEDARAVAVHYYVSSPAPVIADPEKARQTLSHGGEAPRLGNFDRKAAGGDQAVRTRARASVRCGMSGTATVSQKAARAGGPSMTGPGSAAPSAWITRPSASRSRPRPVGSRRARPSAIRAAVRGARAASWPGPVQSISQSAVRR